MQAHNITLEKLFFATKCNTKDQLAHKLGFSYGGLRAAEQNPSPSLYGRIAQLAKEEGISIDWLLGYTGTVPSVIPEYLQKMQLLAEETSRLYNKAKEIHSQNPKEAQA